MLMLTLHIFGRYRMYHVKPAAAVAGSRGAAVSTVSSGADLKAGEGGQLLGSSRGAQLQLEGEYLTGLQLGAITAQLNMSMRWYNSSDGADGAIASGAYIFRYIIAIECSST